MIPNILWQTWKTKSIPDSLKKDYDSWSKSNPQLKRNLVNDSECSSFVLEHFGEEVYKLYLALPQPVMRADFWRIAVVYIYGGYYSDLDITCNAPVKNFIDASVDAVFIREINNILNYFFGASAKHPVLKLALDHMINQMRHIKNTNVQDFGMHPLHQAVRDYYKVIGTNYINTDEVQFILDSDVRTSNKLIHNMASLFGDSDYESWRKRDKIMMQEREESNPILFFTTFNKNGYDLYGKEWVASFIAVANYYNKFRAKIYYEGFSPDIEHPSIEWVNYRATITHHDEWKKEYIQKTTHSDYVKTMTVRFSHKAFVIQHVLNNNSDDYLIWLDGDCVFKNADYTQFPKNILGDKFLACQIEHNHDLNHVESGILIFNGRHPDKEKFASEFKRWYDVKHVLDMSQPYDGFIVFKTLLTTSVSYVDLNAEYGKGGIQSDPSMTFCHPAIKSKFIHNIGWTGKNQYANWEYVFKRDDVYKKMETVLFGSNKNAISQQQKIRAYDKLQKLKGIKAKYS